MADIYDLTVANMKIAVAVPIKNDSFRFWDNPGTWTQPSAWTNSGITNVARSGTSVSTTGSYDDDGGGLVLSGSTCPADDTMDIIGDTVRFWPDNETGFSGGLTFWWSWAHYVTTITTPGASAGFRFRLDVDSAEAMSSPAGSSLQLINAVEAGWTRSTGTANFTGIIGATDRWARPRLIVRDAAAVTAFADNLAVGFNPFSTGAGYETLTAFAEVPDHEEMSGVEDIRLTSGTTLRFDPSGGHRKLRLTATFADEPLAFFEQMHKLYRINHGTPGVPGLPLLLEPNLPGFPPTMVCNIIDGSFPLRRQSSRGNFYGGTFTFESVY